MGVNDNVQLATTLKVEDAKYTSSDTSVATVSESGYVTGLSVGRATVTLEGFRDGKKVVLNTKVDVGIPAAASLNGEEPFIKWEGRYFADEEGVNANNTASGFSVRFFGTRLKVGIKSAGSNQPQIAVLVDDEKVPTDRILTFQMQVKSDVYTVIDNLSVGIHTVRVLKMTEAYTTSVLYTSLETDGLLLPKPEDKALKIEVYGDSITTGHLNLRTTLEEPSDKSSNLIQNGLLTYSWLAAQELDAEISIHARVGIGMTWSYSANYFMKDAYDDAYCSEYNFLNKQNSVWDFEKYVPDIVLINLGTNDVARTGGFLVEEYKTALKNMIYSLNEHYPNVRFVLLSGMMRDTNSPALDSIVGELSSGVNISALKLPKAASGHPRVDDNEKAAQALVDYLKNLMRV
ncbi:MAG TPA: Ig-like domain-containing protein [Clostridia bacterium]